MIREPTFDLQLGLDRRLAWSEGGSVRYAVADLRAAGTAAAADSPALNLALAIDVSGSMIGDKIIAARRTALKVIAALAPRDRLTLVAFDNETELLLDGRVMDAAGRAAAESAVEKLAAGGGTNLWEGWLLAAERVAASKELDALASHRVLLLSDGEANEGVIDPADLARHTSGLLERGILTSAVGIGDGYDELLLGGMAEAGGGRLHDAEHAAEIAEVVLGELLEGRTALLQRTALRFSVPANLRAEVVGGWSHTVLPGVIDVQVGALLPDTQTRVVFRLHCPELPPGSTLLLGAMARGTVPDGSGDMAAGPVETELGFGLATGNNAQPRDLDRSMAALQAWQAETLRRTMTLNRNGDRRGAKHYLERELRYMQRYAMGMAEAEPLLAELVLLLRRVDREIEPRLRKEIYNTTSRRAFYKGDLRSAARASLADRLRDDPA